MKQTQMYVMAVIFPIIFFVGLAGYIQFGVAGANSNNNFGSFVPTTCNPAPSFWEKAKNKAVEQNLIEKPELWQYNAKDTKYAKILVQTLALLALDNSANPSGSNDQLPPDLQELMDMQKEMQNALQIRMEENTKPFYFPPQQTTEPVINVTISNITVRPRAKDSYIVIDGRRYKTGENLPNDQGKITKIEKDQIFVLVGKKEVKVKWKKN